MLLLRSARNEPVQFGIQNNRFGVTFAYPLKPNQGLVFNLSSGVAARAGPDYDTFAVAYQYSWGGS